MKIKDHKRGIILSACGIAGAVALTFWALPFSRIHAETPTLRNTETGSPKPVAVPDHYGNLYFETAWNPRAGLRLKLAPEGGGASGLPDIVLNIHPDKPGLSFDSARASNSARRDKNKTRWNPGALPSEPEPAVEWLLKLRAESWLLYCNDRWVAWFPAPFEKAMNVSASLPRAATGLELQNAFFQRVTHWRFSDDFMLPETDDDISNLGEWMPVSGNWHVHSLADEAGAPQHGRRTLDPEFSPNFYSMKGIGTNAVITTGQDFYDQYRYSAAMELQPGKTGLVFYYSEITREYYAYTLAIATNTAMDAQLTLWHTLNGDPEQRVYLAAARIPDMFPEQWARLEIETGHNRIIARLDGHTVFDIEHNLGGGGKFGLFADADTEIIFDDVSAASIAGLDLRTTDNIHFHAYDIHGDFFSDANPSLWQRLISRSRETPTGGRLEPALSEEDQWLALGVPVHQGQVISATFYPENNVYQVGLVAGLVKPGDSGKNSDSHLRFTAQRSGGETLFRLFEVNSNGRLAMLEQLRRPATDFTSKPLELKLDMSDQRIARFYCNDTLVLIHETQDAPVGAAGPFVGSGTATAIEDIRYGFSRGDQRVSSQEKNPVYLQDPFMRHWSSPEGEWYTDQAGLTWHKSDFFGRYEITLPIVDKASIHLGVGESQTNGALIVTIRNRIATLYDGTTGEESPQRLISAEIPELTNRDENIEAFDLHYEDHWFFITAGGTTVLRHALNAPLGGARVRIEGYTVQHLSKSAVTRHNVDDHLFTEAPAEWRFNGGAWRVVNRFQCDPRWSHMNAESRDNLAAAWTKHIFEGDFSIEMYAGMRHGWYHRCGDMNLTVMSRDGTPSQGYTVTCTGWDPDHSQLDSIFFRNGKELERTDEYLAPRHRASNQRKYLEDIVRAGRDVHGAWYYIKLRRIGGKIEYYFDNQLVFSLHDDDPIDAGRVGIWTYMNSIMIARVSISSRKSTLAPLSFESITLDQLHKLNAGVPGRKDSHEIATAADAAPDSGGQNLPPPAMAYESWEVEDPVGLSRMTWHQDTRYGHYFTLTTRLGSGPMFSRNTMQPQRYRDLAGWQFYLKRTSRAKLNAYFSMGSRNNQGEYSPSQHFFHKISGADFDRGNWRMSGASDVAPVAEAQTRNWHMQGDWRQVNVWLPTDNLPAHPNSDDLWVRFEGFGVHQPSLEMQGIFGNGPGEAYAVARFTPVSMQAPYTGADASAGPATNRVEDGLPDYRLYKGVSRRQMLAQGGIDAVLEAMRDNVLTGMNRFWIERNAHHPGYPRDIAWLEASETIDLTAEWCRQTPDTVVVSSPVGWPERSLAQVVFRINEQSLESMDAGLNRRKISIPPHIAASNPKPPYTLEIAAIMPSGETRSFTLDTADTGRRALGPILTDIEGITQIYENFEKLEFGRFLGADANRMRVRRMDPPQGAYVEIANRARNQRLRAQLSTPICLARYPLLKLRYRGDRMSHLSMRVQDWLVKLNEPRQRAAEVRFATPLINDGEWHSWIGMISEVVERPVFNPKMYTINNILLGSFQSIDQTGIFSRWALSEIVAGPAVSKPEQLEFTPYFEGLVPVESVDMALMPGLDCIHDWNEEQLAGLPWQRIENRKPAQPSPDSLPDGPAQLVLRAMDAQGTWSSPVAIPFLLDRKPPQVAHTLEQDLNPLGNGSFLRLDFDTRDGSPVSLENLALTLNGQPSAEIGAYLNAVSVRAPGLRVQLNWPHLLRETIQQHSSPEPAVLRVSGLRDGAGNEMGDIEVQIDIPDANDTDGPALLPATYPDCILFSTSWKGRLEPPAHFTAAQHNQLSVESQWNTTPFLRTRAHQKTGGISLDCSGLDWSLQDHPYLAFMMRQPGLKEPKPTRVELVLNLDDDQSVTVALTHPADNDRTVPLPEPVPWESNGWYSVILALPDLLRNADITDPGERRVKSIAFQRKDTEHNEPFDIQDFFIFGTWSLNDLVMIDAYDRSGIDGLDWEYRDQHDEPIGNRLEPRDPAPGTAGWLIVRVRDRAGNLSAPMRIPVAPIRHDPAVSFADFIETITHLKPLEYH